MRRSFRETRLQLVQTAVIDLEVRHNVIGCLNAQWDTCGGDLELTKRLTARQQLEVDEEKE